MGSSTGALRGVRVLDATSAMPGAIVTMLLADHGADVIRLDLTAALDAARATQSVARTTTWARGRRVVRIDPDDSEARLAVDRLVVSADIVVVDLHPADARRLGLDPDTVRAANPVAVVTALTGFGLGADDTTPAIDVLVAAELGAVNAATAANRDGPVFLGHPAVAYSTAFNAMIGTLAALRARVVRGHGDLVDVSLLDGVLAQFTMNWWTERQYSFLADRRSDGQLDLGRTRMIVRSYECADGHRIQVHTGAPGAFGRLMTLLGVDDRISPASGAVESAVPLTDADLAVLEELPAIFATRPSDEWLADVWAHEIAALPVLPPAAAFDDDQVRHLGLVGHLADPELGEIEVVHQPIRLAGSPATASIAPDREIGVGDASWLADGLPAHGEPSTPHPQGPLADVQVVELSTFFAAPYANRFLRDLGAHVIKVETTSGDPMRSLPDPFEAVSRGKRSIAIDLKDTSSRPWIERLLASVDIVQHNFRPGVAERLAVDAATVRALNPRVIYDYAPGFGSTGPKSGRQSFAPLHSGFVGIQVEAAGVGNMPTITFGNEDYYNGQLNAIATLLALVHRDRTGEGQDIECSQLASSVFVTSHWYRTPDGERHSALPALDADQFGWSPYQRLYQCLQGWLCVCCVHPSQEASLRSAVFGDDGAHDANQLEYELFASTAADWVAVLRGAGVPCTVAAEGMWLHRYLNDPANVDSGRAAAVDHPVAGAVRVIGRIIRLASAPPREPVRSPRLGEHGREVLRSLGADDTTVESMIDRGAIVVADALTGGPP